VTFAAELYSWAEQYLAGLDTTQLNVAVLPPTEYDNPRSMLLVENDVAAVEMFVWDSGDIEYTCFESGRISPEHIDVTTTVDLHRTFDRFVEDARRLRLG
jgi:hypothetical protein